MAVFASGNRYDGTRPRRALPKKRPEAQHPLRAVLWWSRHNFDRSARQLVESDRSKLAVRAACAAGGERSLEASRVGLPVGFKQQEQGANDTPSQGSTADPAKSGAVARVSSPLYYKRVSPQLAVQLLAKFVR